MSKGEGAEETKSNDFVCSKCALYLGFLRNEEDEPLQEICSVCLGLWQVASTRLVEESLEKACQPYGGLGKNRFTTISNHTVSIGGDVFLRYRHRSTTASSPYSTFQHELKYHLHQRLQEILSIPDDPPPILSNAEQAGYLSIHILCIPAKGHSLLDRNRITEAKKRKRQSRHSYVTQGGDPKDTLERRLQAQGYQWWTLNQTEAVLASCKVLDGIADAMPLEVHVAVFRRPIFLYGYYTKSRRDVSQTPFVVMDEKSTIVTTGDGDHNTTKKEATTLGVTSVEEQICGPIIQRFGVSTQNNLPTGNQIYGMCKFHASGREDMDVRMLLRPNTKGRPFCIQLVDALRPLESTLELEQIVEQINSGDGKSSIKWYGSNPMGVGIAPDLQLVEASAFSTLQADTESKVKHYGCHCWSEAKLAQDCTFDLANLQIQQRTPLRVLHRRANLTRERQVLALRGTRVDDHHFRLELSTQAGTYVKEFVHGDLRRTTPNMATLLDTKTNLLLLDCEGIELGGESAGRPSSPEL